MCSNSYFMFWKTLKIAGSTKIEVNSRFKWSCVYGFCENRETKLIYELNEVIKYWNAVVKYSN